MSQSVSPNKCAINTAILEGHVKDVITSAKNKIQELQQDIQNLNSEYDMVCGQVSDA